MRLLLAQAVVCKKIDVPNHMVVTSSYSKYVAAGEYIVNRCDVLLALWDKKTPNFTTMTASPSTGEALTTSYAWRVRRERMCASYVA